MIAAALGLGLAVSLPEGGGGLGKCSTAVNTCEDLNPCTIDSCEGTTGCLH